jgi:hypothetical protein
MLAASSRYWSFRALFPAARVVFSTALYSAYVIELALY